MRTAVWVTGTPDELRALLRTRSARPRRLVATERGTFLLGPAPEDGLTLLDGLRVSTTGAQPALGLAWTDRTAWLVARTEDDVTGVRFGPDPMLDRGFADADLALTDEVASDLGFALGVHADGVRHAVDVTSGSGLPRLFDVLRQLDRGSEADALEWLARQDTSLVPTHHAARWPEVLFGELRGTGWIERKTLRYITGGPGDPLFLAVVLLGFLAGAPLLFMIAYTGFPWPANLVMIALVCLSTLYGLLFIVPKATQTYLRLRRADPFPLSDPLHVLPAGEPDRSPPRTP